ncbi:hypothetical protein V1478_007174 [Vespula squamosa]|uniref:Uncharacterized protein n=1 Tax=Vespula squamosa TaxID=30214 RepID=A0ABD2B2F1_VESSQ
MGQRSYTRKRPRRGGEGEKNGSHILLLRASRDTGTDLPDTMVPLRTTGAPQFRGVGVMKAIIQRDIAGIPNA